VGKIVVTWRQKKEGNRGTQARRPGKKGQKGMPPGRLAQQASAQKVGEIVSKKKVEKRNQGEENRAKKGVESSVVKGAEWK